MPFLKIQGGRHVFVDTDGNFHRLIPNFIEAGVEGFLPIVEVRKECPNFKLIGGFNKNMIEEGTKAIDQEFERLLPIIRQCGYIPGCDHQVPPTASLKNYRYYVESLFSAMEQAGRDI